MRVMVPISYYLPAFKAGGPIKTVSNIVKILGKEIEFYIVTRNNDIDGKGSLTDWKLYSWNQVGDAKVSYLNKTDLKIKSISKILKSVEYDVLYLNSFFSFQFTILPLLLRYLRILPQTPAIIGPRGEFSNSALELKKTKKAFYLFLARYSGLLNNVTWQASSSFEEEDIRRVIGKKASIVVAPDFVIADSNSTRKESLKEEGRLSIIFLSRISKMKNLKGALDVLKNIKEGNILFNIYGPIEDKEYWEECQKVINKLPENINVYYKGEVPSNEVNNVMKEHDLFFLPTFGEGFGHVIIEALSSGCPVLISDRTPWRDLALKNVGWDIPLEEMELFEEKIRSCLKKNSDEFNLYREKAIQYSSNLSEDSTSINQHRFMFNKALKYNE